MLIFIYALTNDTHWATRDTGEALDRLTGGIGWRAAAGANTAATRAIAATNMNEVRS
ncbi:MAG: hypothetical protein WD673_02770 [Alphaproteobacteria bacterium]